MSDQLGWLDTGVFVHALFVRDPQHARCNAIVDALNDGSAEGWVGDLVVHELTYVLLRLPQFGRDRHAVSAHIQGILLSPGVRCEQLDILLGALGRWATRGVAFTDAWLWAKSLASGLAICSANERDFPPEVPNTYPVQN